MNKINRQDILELAGMLEKSSRPVIISHMKPDGDAIGSCLGMYHFLKQIGKENADIVLNDREPKYLSFLTSSLPEGSLTAYSEKPEAAIMKINAADLIICLDFNAFHRAGDLEDVLTHADVPKILIDHHIGPDRAAFDLCFSETEVSSASEYLYQILMETPVIGNDFRRLSLEIAEALMTGMTTDTNNFANSVYPSTLRMASDLIERGVDRDRILNFLFNQHSENRLRLMGHMMKDMLKITGDGVAYIVLDRSTQERYQMQEGDTEGFVNLPLSIATVRMSILAKEDSGKIRISIRSRKGVSANRCARGHFNGGGHENAAGGKLFIPVDEVAGYIEEHTHIYFSKEHE